MALVRTHEDSLRWRLPPAPQMIRKPMKTLQTMACAIAFAVPHVVAAQANPPEDRSAAMAAPQLTYKSAFEDYIPYEDVPVADWRRVNDTVRDAAAKGGGHGGHGAQDRRAQKAPPQVKKSPPRPHLLSSALAMECTGVTNDEAIPDRRSPGSSSWVRELLP